MKNRITVILSALLVSACSLESTGLVEPTVEEWEHGFKTKNVIATRYTNKMFGYNIGFTFPGHEYDSDRAETFEFFKKFDGWVASGGGYPGAPLLVVFKGVKDKETANAKLALVMPELEKHARKLGR